jgi:2-polyprenyl-3-methyl-5-hydroxy-6-metoxy-1,4-benzoquinol methylase/tetratricopeptide (TPR) repeat protein
MSLLSRLIRNAGAGLGAGKMPDYSGLMTAGCEHQAAGRFAEAVQCFDQALTAQPGSADAHVCRAVAFKSQGETAKAIGDTIGALALADTPVARQLFVTCVTELDCTRARPEVAGLLARALAESWCSPQQLAPTAIRMLRQDSAISACMSNHPLFDPACLGAMAGNELLLALLTAIPVCDAELERILTLARRAMLEQSKADESLLRFGAALARQCFINEYVFGLKDEEAAKAGALKQTLQSVIRTQGSVAPSDLTVLGSYFPLNTLQGAEALLAMRWAHAVEKLLTQQIREPAEEKKLATDIPQITAIDNQVSVLVREQYEANPYPRWVSTVPANPIESIEAFISLNFPHASCRPAGGDANPDILIAGCGTGQHSIQIGSQFPGASVLAIDLSLSSLTYAKRKTEELGITNIEYAQADILELKSLARQFHLIETAGVLHHMGDPLAGWRVLLGLLRPDGIMAVGLYSEKARQGIVAAHRFIAEKGYGSSAAGIRRCRADMMAPDASSRWSFESPDFFSLSACRDLLFHVQESRFDLSQIKAFLAENGLNLLGFVLPMTVKAQYSARFPDDIGMTNLDNWDAFETDNPNIFDAMYMFYVQKR